MKLILSLLLCLGLSFSLTAQPSPGFVFDSDDHSHPLFLEPIGDSMRIVSNLYNTESCEYSHIYLGKGLSLTSSQLDEGWYSYAWYKKVMGRHYVMQMYYTDDVNDAGIRIDSIDTDNMEFVRTDSINYTPYSYDTYTYPVFPVDFCPLPNDEAFILQKDSLLLFDDAGNLIFKRGFPIESDFTSMVWDDTNLFVSNQMALYRTDTNFALRDSILVNESILQFDLIRDTLYLLSSNFFLRADKQMKLIDTIFQLPENTYDISFKDSDQGLWVSYTLSDNIYFKNILPTIPIIPIELDFQKRSEPFYFLVSGPLLVTHSESFSHQAALSYYHDELAFVDDAEIDIKLNEIDIDTVVPAEKNYGFTYKLNYTVVNNSNFDIDSFAAFIPLNGGMNCFRAQYYHRENGFKMEKFSEKSFTTDFIFEYGTLPVDHEVCLEVMAPNGWLESNVSNNKICKTFHTTDLVNTSLGELSVWPNPAADRVYFDNRWMDTGILNIYTLTGEQVSSITAQSGTNQVDISDLSNGIYLVSFTGHNKSWVGKFVKL